MVEFENDIKKEVFNEVYDTFVNTLSGDYKKCGDVFLLENTIAKKINSIYPRFVNENSFEIGELGAEVIEEVARELGL